MSNNSEIIRQIPTKYYVQGTQGFVQKYLRLGDSSNFATVDQVLRHHANFIWYNIVLHNTWDFPFTQWTHDSEEIRLQHLIRFIGKVPVFSTEFGNFGWNNLELLNTKEPRKGRPIRPTYRIELVMLYLYLTGDLQNKKIDDIRSILQEVSGRRISKSIITKLLKKHFLTKNGIIVGVQSGSF